MALIHYDVSKYSDIPSDGWVTIDSMSDSEVRRKFNTIDPPPTGIRYHAKARRITTMTVSELRFLDETSATNIVQYGNAHTPTGSDAENYRMARSHECGAYTVTKTVVSVGEWVDFT